MPESVARHRETAAAKNNNSGDLRNDNGTFARQYTTQSQYQTSTIVTSSFNSTTSSAGDDFMNTKAYALQNTSMYLTKLAGTMGGDVTASEHADSLNIRVRKSGTLTPTRASDTTRSLSPFNGPGTGAATPINSSVSSINALANLSVYEFAITSLWARVRGYQQTTKTSTTTTTKVTSAL